MKYLQIAAKDDDLALEHPDRAGEGRRDSFVQDMRKLGRVLARWTNILLSYKQYLFSNSPFLMTMFAGAASRHCAGFTWAYNCRLYFQSYYPGGGGDTAGLLVVGAACLGGGGGVMLGGVAADRLAGSGGAAAARARLVLLGTAMICSAPFAAGVLALHPPAAIACLFCYYLLGRLSQIA